MKESYIIFLIVLAAGCIGAAFIYYHGMANDGSANDTSINDSITVPENSSVHDAEEPERFYFFRGADGHDVQVWNSTGMLIFMTQMMIDADGSPRAYHPMPDSYLGTDDLENAGEGSEWWALALDGSGDPCVQGADDPYPGFYVSTTALADEENEDDCDPAKYVDSEEIPYFVLPEEVFYASGARLGDIGMVMNTQNGRKAYAILADLNNNHRMGEGSIALARELGIDPDPRTGGEESDVVIYAIFTGSGKWLPMGKEEITKAGQELSATYGDVENIYAGLE